MNYKSSFLALLTILFLAAGCEEVIQLDLESSEPRLVIEANVDATNGVCTVLLRKSNDFYAENTYESVGGASVSLQAAGMPAQPLTEEQSGRYRLDNLLVSPGEQLKISVTLPDGQLIESETVASPRPVTLDTVLIEKTTGSTGGPGGVSQSMYTLTTQWQDPAGEENFYRLKIYKNGIFQADTYILTDDRLGDGAPIVRPILRQSFEEGDTVRCALLSVNKACFEYFVDLSNSLGLGLSASTPFNPAGNFADPAALGYFGAWQVSEKTVIIR